MPKPLPQPRQPILKLITNNLNPKSRELDQLTHFRQVGSSGTDISGGYFFEEYLNSLTSRDAARVYDEMRRSDDQVKMLLRLVKNPIISAEWDIEAVDETPEELEIRDFAKFVFFENMGNPRTGKIKTWKSFIIECLTMIEFGFCIFEVSHKVVKNDEEFGDYIGIKEIGWRSPKTIEQWNLNQDGSINNVRQLVVGDLHRDIEMKGNFIFTVAPNKEGDNYEGISDIRPIYGNWFRKNFLRKLQMIGIERASTGVPTGQIPSGKIDSEEQTVFEEILQAFVSHEKNYILIPEGWEIGQFKVEHDAKKVMEMIDQENEGMSRSFLANFMELGIGRSGGGSFALGTDLSDMFLSGIQYYPDLIIDTGNIKLMKPIIDAKYGPRRKYPKFSVTGINDKKGEEFAKILVMLKNSGLIQDTPKVKASIHKAFKLPEFDEEEEKKRQDEVKSILDKPSIPEPGKDPEEKPELAELADVNDNVGQQMKTAGKSALTLFQAGMKTRGDDYIEEVIKTLKNNPKSKALTKVKNLIIPFKSIYKRGLQNFYADLANDATNQVLSELSLSQTMIFNDIDDLGKSVPSDTKIGTNNEVDLLVDSHDNELAKQVTFTVNSNLEKLNVDQTAAQLQEVLDAYLSGSFLRLSASNSAANTTNLARNAVYQTKEVLDGIESFIFTNPSPKAAVCVNLKGRVFTKAEYLTTANLPALHHNCNSWIQAQLIDRPSNMSINPLGLAFTGTDIQVEAIIKSKTF